MNIKLNQETKQPLYLQISAQIKSMIESEEIVIGYKLPPERKLAEELGVHRNTIIKAYDELIAEGCVIASRKKPKGYFVGKIGTDDHSFGRRFFPLEKAFRYEFKTSERKFSEVYWRSEEDEPIPFGGMIPDRKIDPIEDFGGYASRIFCCSGRANMKMFGKETYHLRENICKLLSNKNIYVTPRNLQLVAETNQAIVYIATLYLREGDTIVAEGPMVPDTYNIFYNRSINVVTVPMENDGMDLKALEFALKSRNPKFIYSMPNFHNPTGILTSLHKRQQILKLANRYGVPIIEDDYQNDFSYMEKNVPNLYSLDANKMVIYINSFTVTFPYAIKTGYAVGPRDFIDLLTYALEADETVIGNVGAYILNDYIDSGKFEKHLYALRSHYAKKLELLCNELDKIEKKGLTYKRPKGGLVVWCNLVQNLSERKVCKYIEDKNVIVMPGWIFYDDNPERSGHVRLCFSNVSDEEIAEGVKRIGEALEMAGEEMIDE